MSFGVVILMMKKIEEHSIYMFTATLVLCKVS